MGRVLAFGDIHGCDIAFDALLEVVQPTAEDTLVVLGDVVDRGPGTRQVVERLLELKDRCRLVFLMGNHEEMMLDAFQSGEWAGAWLGFGGRETLDSYGGTFENIPPEHLEFLAAGLTYFETETDIFIHASLDPDKPLEEQSPQTLRWDRITGFERPHLSGKRVICGHSTQPSGMPLILDGWICIDTCVYGPGFLTCLDTHSNELYQTSQEGALRTGFTVADLEV
jgi:serine/threonine protein phosphatase 1